MIGLSPDYGPERFKFDPGRIVATPGVLKIVHGDDLTEALNRHLRGDWGDLCDEDKATNDYSFRQGGRLVSEYQTKDKIRFWIITEADRSLTTFLLPEDY